MTEKAAARPIVRCSLHTNPCRDVGKYIVSYKLCIVVDIRLTCDKPSLGEIFFFCEIPWLLSRSICLLVADMAGSNLYTRRIFPFGDCRTLSADSSFSYMFRPSGLESHLVLISSGLRC